MEVTLIVALLTAAWLLKAHDQRRRILLLGRHLANYRIEKHMETLSQGYLRALGEADPQRQEAIWNILRTTEQALRSEFDRFAADIAGLPEAETRVSKLPMALPHAARWLPTHTFDFRRAIGIHADGIRRAVDRSGEPTARDSAFTLSAELFLMQHTCHWFCKSRTVASARMLARHQTAYDQLLSSVSRETRTAYEALLGGAR
jgi:hypothetical protein